jgi:hypothetical protein
MTSAGLNPYFYKNIPKKLRKKSIGPRAGIY